MVDYPIQTQESGLGNSPSSFDTDFLEIEKTVNQRLKTVRTGFEFSSPFHYEEVKHIYW